MSNERMENVPTPVGETAVRQGADEQAVDLWQQIEDTPDAWTVRQQAEALLEAGAVVARRLHAHQRWLDALTERAGAARPHQRPRMGNRDTGEH